MLGQLQILDLGHNLLVERSELDAIAQASGGLRRLKQLNLLGNAAAVGPEGSSVLGESKRLVVESPWSQLTSECRRFGHPPRLND